MCAALVAEATHLVGGYIGYRHLGRVGNQVRYAVTLYVYRDCTSDIEFDDRITLCAFYENRTLYSSYSVRLIRERKVDPVGNTSCPELRQACLMQGQYETTITLPLSSQGFHLKWERCCRNDQNNLPNGSDGRPYMGQTYYAFIPRTDIKNSSPVFLDVPVPFICANDTTVVRNRAVDEDNDSLVYRFVTPWQGASTNDPFPDACEPVMSMPRDVTYNFGFNASRPFGNGGVSDIDTRNGLTTYMARNEGRYAVAIEIMEYRNGVLLSRTRLDLQILVITCRPNNKPRIVSPTTSTYTVRAGRQLCFDITATDADVNDNIRLRAYGDLFTGANGFTGTRATLPDATGRRTVTSKFCWTPDCDQAKSEPYVFTVEVVDDGCPGKFINQNFLIYVQPFQSTARANGPGAVCQESKGVRYNVLGQQPGTTFRWEVRNGTISGAATGPNITVDWGSADTGFVTVTEISPEGCPGTPNTLRVFLSKAPQPTTINGPRIVCKNNTESYTLSTLAPGDFLAAWSVQGGSGTLVSGTNPVRIDVRWNTKGSGFVAVSVQNAIGCRRNDTIFTDIRFPETGPITGPLSVCPNNNGFIYSLSPTPRSSYRWFVEGGTQSGGGQTSRITVAWGNPGTGRVLALETDSNGCVGDTVALRVNKSHSLEGQTPVGPVNVCEFDSLVAYTVLPKPNTTFRWAVDGGVIRDGQGIERLRVDWGARGTGQIRMTEEGFDPVNQLPCLSNEILVPVTIHPVPARATVQGVFEVCQGSGSGVYRVNGFPGSTYQWSLEGNNSFTGQGTNSITINFTEAGSFRLRVRETTAAGCPGPENDTLLIVHPRPIISVIQGDAVICYPNLGPYNYTVNGFPGSTYRWTLSGGTFQNPPAGPAVNVTWNDIQNGSLSVVEISDFGCQGDSIVLPVFIDKPSIRLRRVTVTPPPSDDRGIIVEWELINAPRYNDLFFIMRREAGSAGPFVLAGTAAANAGSFVDFNVQTDRRAYDYSVLAVNLCGDTFSTGIHTTVLLTGERIGRYGVGMNFTDYKGWTAGVRDYELLRQLVERTGYENYANFPAPVRSTYENGLEWFSQCYRIRAQENGGDQLESWSNDVCFDFEPTLFVPNAFSPNEDGNNDRFGVFAGSIRTFRMAIYNRWGEKMFESSDMQASWDGKFKGRYAPDGVYVVLVDYTDYKNRSYSTKTSVHLLR